MFQLPKAILATGPQFLLELASEDVDHAVVAKKKQAGSGSARAKHPRSRSDAPTSTGENDIARLVDAMEKIKNDPNNRYIRGADGEKGGWPLVFKRKYPDAPLEVIRQLVGIKNVLGAKYYDIYQRIGRHKAVIVASVTDEAMREALLDHGLKDADGVLRPLEKVGERELSAHVRGLDRRTKTRRERGGRGGPTIRWPHHLGSALQPLLHHHEALRKAHDEDASGETWSDGDHPRPRLAELRKWKAVLESITGMITSTVNTLEHGEGGAPGRPAPRIGVARVVTSEERNQSGEDERTAKTPALLRLLELGGDLRDELTRLRQRVMKEKTPPLNKEQRHQVEQLAKLFHDLWSALYLED